MKVCPQCRKVSHINKITQRSKCQHCGFLLCTWTEKRAHPRIAGCYRSTIRRGNNRHEGLCLDISHEGFRIAYDGKALDTGIQFDLAVEDINAEGKAEVVWSRQYSSHTAHIGVKKI